MEVKLSASNTKKILKKITENSFSSLQELSVFLYIAENPSSTIKAISEEYNFQYANTKRILSALKHKELINSVDDLTDKGNSKLKRQLYFLSQNGQNKYSQLLSAEM